MSKLLNFTGSSGYYALSKHHGMKISFPGQRISFMDSLTVSVADITDWCDAGERGVDRG